MFKNKVLKVSGIILSSLLVLTACGGYGGGAAKAGQTAQGSSGQDVKPITLKGLTAWEEKNIDSIGYHIFKENIEKISNGRIKIKYVGGPEAIPPFNQGEAIRTGVADFSVISASYYSDTMPEGLVMNYSTLTAQQERESGAMDYLNEIYSKKMNAHYVGRAHTLSYSLFFGKSVKKLESITDLKGLRIRGTSTYKPTIEAMGAASVVMPTSEIYTSLERGVINGFGMPQVGMSFFSLQEQVKYQIRPTFNKIDAGIIFNLDTWKGLPEDVKKMINEAAIETEKELVSVQQKYDDEEQKKLQAAGVVTVELGEQFGKQATEASWKWFKTQSSEHGKKLEELFRK